MAFTDYFYKLRHGKRIADLEDMFKLQCERIIGLWRENVVYEPCTSSEDLNSLHKLVLNSAGCQNEREFWLKFQSEAYIASNQRWLVEKIDEEQIRIVQDAFRVELAMTEEFYEGISYIINNDYAPIEDAYFEAIWNLHPCTLSPQKGLPAGAYIRYKEVVKILLEFRYFICHVVE